jgi:hypothetical protein
MINYNHTRKVLLVVTLVAILGVLFYSLITKYQAYQAKITQDKINQDLLDLKKDEVKEYKIEGYKESLIKISFKPGDLVVGKFIFTGTTIGGYFFEGNMPISVLNQNKQILKTFPSSATTDWMTTDPVSFSAVIDVGFLDTSKVENQTGYIRLSMDDPKDGDLNKGAIDIPVRFK